MIAAFIASFVMIFVAEMGDKTQLLALAFASKYRISRVLAGVFIATLLLNGAAVGAGRFLCAVVPFKVISFAAALSFILFGVLALKKDEDARDNPKESSLGPVITVALAFILAELGDKTQLAAISLSVEYKSFLGVLSGATAGMFLADTAGIIAGGIIKKYLPDNYIRRISAAIFILFGLWSLWNLVGANLGPAR